MRGFVAILAAMAVFVAAFVAFSGSAPQAHGASFNESFSGAKLMMTDIELSSIMAAQDCNWLETDASKIRSCIDSNASAIIGALSAPYTVCVKGGSSVNTGTKTFYFDISCTTIVQDAKGTVFKNEFSRRISGKKYP